MPERVELIRGWHKLLEDGQGATIPADFSRGWTYEHSLAMAVMRYRHDTGPDPSDPDGVQAMRDVAHALAGGASEN